MSLAEHAMSAGRLFRTVRHLKPIQIFNRASRFALARRPAGGPPLPERNWPGTLIEPVARRAAWDGAGGFRFLNETWPVIGAAGWNAPQRDKLWLYHLHYFDDLAAQPPAGPPAALIRRWIAENPPGQGNGWEPYPTSLRIVNWIKWHQRGERLDPAMLASLANQARHLARRIEYHLLGNHLLANAKALVWAGLFFAGREADSWLARGSRILSQQIAEQVLADGAHFELSPTYHALLTEDMLDLINLGQAAGVPMPAAASAAGRMLSWLAAMVRPDRRLPLFNDATYGGAPAPGEVFAYARSLGLTEPPPPQAGFSLLAASGYARFASPRLWSVFDFGQPGPDYLLGHAHCDMFSFELAVDGAPLIVDTGVSTYNAGPRRLAERGTAAHNTVQVGTAEQSEIWSSFRVGRRARLRGREAGLDRISASHDGFAALGLTHRREVCFADRGISISDTLHGADSAGPATARLHFHPEALPRLAGGTIAFGSGQISFEGADAVTLSPYDYAPDFNCRVPALAAEIAFGRQLKTVITVG